MFWKRKKSRKVEPEKRPAQEPISDEDLGKLADGAIESLAGLVRAFGEKGFDIEGTRAEETQEACERWARHIMVGSPAHPSHERVEAAGDDAAPDSEPAADAPEPASIEPEDDAKPQPILRDFANLLRYFGSHRSREKGYVTGSLSDLRLVIWSMVQGLRGAVTHDRTSDQAASEQLRRLGVAVEGRSTEKIRREARECIRLIGSLIKEREARQKQQIEELGARVTKMRSELEEAWEETTRDALTGLRNRAAFDKQIERVADIGFLFSERAYLFMIDLDHFKWVNDRYGHPAGDEVLREVANRLRDTVSRSNDFVSRYGGEEFAVLLRVNRKDLAEQLAESVSLAVRDEISLGDGEEIRVTTSIGIAELGPGEGSETWLKRADAALYAAKDAGRDRCVFAPPHAAPETLSAPDAPRG